MPALPAQDTTPYGPFDSPACDAVIAAEHPSPENGGPCSTCAFRRGTVPNLTEHTQIQIRLCVEGFRQFDCHEKPQVCRGFIAALNLRGVPQTEDDKRHCEAAGFVADLYSRAIDAAAEAQKAAR